MQDGSVNHHAWSVQRWIMLGIACLLFLLPQNDRDVIVCSQHELRTWQLKSFMASLLIGLSSLVCASQLASARTDWAISICCGVALLCLLVTPGFFRLCAWRIWVGTALIAVAFLN
jgi:hypothetical protein